MPQPSTPQSQIASAGLTGIIPTTFSRALWLGLLQRSSLAYFPATLFTASPRLSLPGLVGIFSCYCFNALPRLALPSLAGISSRYFSTALPRLPLPSLVGIISRYFFTALPRLALPGLVCTISLLLCSLPYLVFHCLAFVQ